VLERLQNPYFRSLSRPQVTSIAPDYAPLPHPGFATARGASLADLGSHMAGLPRSSPCNAVNCTATIAEQVHAQLSVPSRFNTQPQDHTPTNTPTHTRHTHMSMWVPAHNTSTATATLPPSFPLVDVSLQLALLRNYTLISPPGTSPSYSNAGFAFLGR
jgi:hypothetical protein